MTEAVTEDLDRGEMDDPNKCNVRIIRPDEDEDESISESVLEEYFAASTFVRNEKRIDGDYLSKVWRIPLEEANRTINVTTQRCVPSENQSLVRNIGTNDRMLRYKRLNTHFFMDTFFATKTATKSTRGNTCCQIFVTDKGCTHVEPMRCRSDILCALKSFAKEIGVPEAFIVDAAKEQNSLKVKKFLNDIGTIL